MTHKKENIAKHKNNYTEPARDTGCDGNNMLLSQNIYWSLDSKMEGCNDNVLVVGDTNDNGAHSFFASNLLQANCSYVVHDRGGMLYRQYAGYLEHKGYSVRCLNLIDPRRSNCYNPFRYIYNDKDIPVMVNALLENTTRLDNIRGDPSWFRTEAALLMALTAYLKQFCPPDKQSLSGIMELLRTVNISSDTGFSTMDDFYQSIDMSPLDAIFDALPSESLAFKWYANFRMGAGRSMQKDLASCIFRLQFLDLPKLKELTETDSVNLETIGEEKTALFVITPMGHDDFNFLAAIMLSQAFERAYDYCEDMSKYSQIVLDGNGHVIRNFRAEDEASSEEALKKAERFLFDTKSAEIIYKEGPGWFEAVTKDGDAVLHRGTKEDAEKELSLISDGGHISQNRYRLPVKAMFLLDNSAFLGEIPRMDYRVATCCKYNMSIAMGFHTFRQLKKQCRNNWGWEDIVRNCSTFIYTGGMDPTTANWVSSLMEKMVMGYESCGNETIRKMFQLILRKKTPAWEETIHGKAPVNITGFVYTPSQLQQLPPDECIVLQMHRPSFRDLQCVPER